MTPDTKSDPRPNSQAPEPAVASPAHSLGSFLTGLGAATRSEWLALLRADQHKRWRRNDRISVEAYLDVMPELQTDAEVVVDLIFSEVLLREERGERPQPEEYLRRFPKHRERLARQFALHQALDLAFEESRSKEGSASRVTLTSPPNPASAAATRARGEPEGPKPLEGTTARESATVELPRMAGNTILATSNEWTEFPPRSDQPEDLWATAPPRLIEPTRYPSLPPKAGPAHSAALVPMVTGYHILSELGRGGMGVVYLARDTSLQRLVALKMGLSGNLAGSEELARFRTEAEALARLNHPNIVAVYEVAECEGRPYLAMEFVEGGTLASRLRDCLPEPKVTAALLETLARAMHAAHGCHVVHRDLKPANVLLTADGTPKVTDFGLAKRLDDDSGKTRSNAIMGTASYMAPEQAEGGAASVTPLADIYALGAILYACLTGRPPFKAATLFDTLLQVRCQEPVPPSRFQPGVPRDLETICLKCLEKDKNKRYPTSEALADDLQRFLKAEPIRARPTPIWERLGKWARRKPVVAALIGVTLVAAVALVSSIALYARYQSQQAGIYKQDLRRLQEKEELRNRSRQNLLRAQQHETAGNWIEANTELEKVQETLEAQPEVLADEMRAEVGRRLAVVRQKLQELEQGKQAKNRLQGFQAPYRDALFYQTLFTGDIAETQAKIRAACRSALAIYGLENETVSENVIALLDRDRPYNSDTENAQLASACYELLLILAETEATSTPGQDEAKEHGRRGAKKALNFLERAAELGRVYGLETRTYHLRKIRYTAQSNGEKFDRAAAEKAAPQTLAGRLDWFLTALEKYQEDKYAESIVFCDQVLRVQTDDFWARYIKALGQLRLGQWLNARAELTVCLNLKQDFVWPRLLRGFASSELGFRHMEALRNLPVERPILAAEEKKLGDDEFEAAEKDFNSALERERDPLVQYVGLSNRGVLNIRRQRWAPAVADLQHAVDANPKGFQGYVNLAQAFQGQKKWDEAYAALDRALKLAPHLPVLYESRARLHLLRRNRPAARAEFEQAIILEPKDSKSERLVNNLVELGRLQHRDRDFLAALAAYDRALELKPEFVLAQRLRAETLLALGRGEEAGRALDRYLAATKKAPAAVYHARGLIYAERGELPAAIEMYTLELRQNSKDLETRCHRGWTYLLSDAVRLALIDFEVCLSDDPTSTDALIGRGNARVRLKQLDGALEDARAAEEQGRLTYLMSYNLARIYAQVADQLELAIRAKRIGLDRGGMEPLVRHAERLPFYKDKTLELLQQTLEKLPEERRPQFWRTQVEADPAMTVIRDTRLYLRLAARYAATGS
jgi:serine/threonine protein kinase/predicted Zn-dependent protease